MVGRYANRIAGARLPLDGRTYALPANDGPHTLHGGRDGFHRRLWRVTQLDERPCPRVRMELVSPDGDMGFPATLLAAATYTVDGWSVRADLAASSTAPTVVNLTHHTYWNLGQHPSDVRDHALRGSIPANTINPYGTSPGAESFATLLNTTVITTVVSERTDECPGNPD